MDRRNALPKQRVTIDLSLGRLHDLAPPKLSVIVPVYNGAPQLSRCLQALRLSQYSSIEIIVVDDCSTDNAKQVVENYGACYVRTPRTLGPAGARNMGVASAHGSIFVFVDSDVAVPPDALQLIAQDFIQDPSLAAVFGAYDDEPAWDDFLSQYKNLMHSYVHLNSNECAMTFWAGCGAIRRGSFIECGGFNATRYRQPSIEDIELGYRLSRAGKKIKLNKQLKAKHLKRWTLSSLLKADILRRAIPWTKLSIETRRLPRDLNLTSGARVSAGLVGLLCVASTILFLQAINVLPKVAHTLVPGVAAVLVVAMLLVIVNRDVYAFFTRKRGWWFAARAIPMHWFYYFYSGAAFVICGTMVGTRLALPTLLVGLRGFFSALNHTQSS
jgi:glycosyltransferase involved in cell wall biosynthesis